MGGGGEGEGEGGVGVGVGVRVGGWVAKEKEEEETILIKCLCVVCEQYQVCYGAAVGEIVEGGGGGVREGSGRGGGHERRKWKGGGVREGSGRGDYSHQVPVCGQYQVCYGAGSG